MLSYNIRLFYQTYLMQLMTGMTMGWVWDETLLSHFHPNYIIISYLRPKPQDRVD